MGFARVTREDTAWLPRSAVPSMPARPMAMGFRGVVATPHYLATSAGLRVLQDGGNALDACVAACAVLGVVHPNGCGIGGDLFLLIHPAGGGHPWVLNASGRAGSKATPDFIRAAGHDRLPDKGPLSVVTPGCVAGWQAALERFGTRELGALLQPAISWAEDGFPADADLAHALRGALRQFNEEARRTFAPDDRLPEPGNMIRQPELGRALRRIASGGARAMYDGPLGQAIGQFLQIEGGHHTPDDMAAYECEWAEPVQTDFRGYSVYSAPPNSQGLLHLMALGILEPKDLGEPQSAQATHLQLEAMKFGYESARRQIADPAFHRVPTARLLSESHAAAGRAQLSAAQAASPPPVPGAGDTVYLCSVDREGNLVSMIQSLRQGLGAGLMVPGTGILLNNRARDFGLADGDPNQIAPGKRPRHTLAPGLVLRDGKPAMAYGTRGGDGQPYTMLQLSCNLLAFGMDAQAALDAPRWSVEPADSGLAAGKIVLEGRFSGEARETLQEAGYDVRAIQDFDERCGVACIVQIDRQRGVFLGGADPRGEGLALAF